jgi:hypothetical protein
MTIYRQTAEPPQFALPKGSRSLHAENPFRTHYVAAIFRNLLGKPYCYAGLANCIYV